MPLRPIHRSPFSPDRRPPEAPDRVAAAVRGTRAGAVLAAVVAVLLFVLRGSPALLGLPFPPEVLVAVAFLAPVLLGLLRPGGRS